MHFHLVNLQIVNRVNFTNTVMPPDANELGWKETVRTNPFTDVILAAQPKSMVLPFAIPRASGSWIRRRWQVPQPITYSRPRHRIPNPAGISNALTDYNWEYVWHCHILGHEENDMMRPIVFFTPRGCKHLRHTAGTDKCGCDLRR